MTFPAGHDRGDGKFTDFASVCFDSAFAFFAGSSADAAVTGTRANTIVADTILMND
jgi:hypothetical protein